MFVSQGSELEACLNFPAPGGYKSVLTLSHTDGTDNWQPEWIRLLYDDSTFSVCYDGNYLEPGSSHTLECGPYAG